jgi:DNA invertase Pin-like site-specific DNA recombinase
MKTISDYAIAYTRVSLDFETQAHSVQVNDGKIRDYCGQRHLTVAALFQEDITGKVPMEKRPEGRRVLDALDHGIEWQGELVRPGHLIFGAVDRIGRRAAAMMNLVEGLLKRGIQVHIAEAGIGCIDLNEPAGWQMFQMLCVFAEGEQRRTAKRIGDTIVHRRQAGYLVGTVPYGQRAVPTGTVRTLRSGQRREEKRLEPDPEQQRVLREIILPRRYRDRVGTVRIARELNDLAIPTRQAPGELVKGHQGLPVPSRGIWTQRHVDRILANLYTAKLARELGFRE